MPMKKEASKTIALLPSLGSQTGYQVGPLALVFLTIAVLLNLIFYFDYFRFPMTIGGLILALIICRNVGFTFAWSKKEIAASILLLFTIGFVLVLLAPLNYSTDPSAWSQWSNFLVTSLFGPTMEEIIYRLFLLNLVFILIGRRFQAILISSVLFMTPHIGLYYTDVPALIDVFAGSIVMGIAFLYTKNLSTTVAIHSANNILASISSFATQYPYLVPSFLGIIFSVVFAVLGFSALVFYVEKNSESELGLRTLRSWLTKREGDTHGGSGFTVTCLAFVVFAFCVYILPFTVTVSLVPTGIASESFYLLGVLGWSQFQVIRYYNLPPFNYPLPVPDPLLLPFVTMIFVFAIVSLGIDAVIRLKQRKSAKATYRKRKATRSNDFA